MGLRGLSGNGGRSGSWFDTGFKFRDRGGAGSGIEAGPGIEAGAGSSFDKAHLLKIKSSLVRHYLQLISARL